MFQVRHEDVCRGSFKQISLVITCFVIVELNVSLGKTISFSVFLPICDKAFNRSCLYIHLSDIGEKRVE